MWTVAGDVRGHGGRDGRAESLAAGPASAARDASGVTFVSGLVFVLAAGRRRRPARYR